jgi:hypothetical protein
MLAFTRHLAALSQTFLKEDDVFSIANAIDAAKNIQPQTFEVSIFNKNV